MSGGATPQSSTPGGSLAAVAPILSALMQRGPQPGGAPMQHPMMPQQGQPLAPMPAPPMSGAPGLLGGMGGAAQGGLPPQVQQLLMQQGLLGGMPGGRPY